MKKITKRITALIIAAMMLASMIPAAFAATGETVKEKYEFIFTNGSHGHDEDKTVLFDKTNVVNNFTLNGTVSGDKWGYVSAWHPNAATAYSNRLLYSYNHTSSRAKGYVYDPDEGLYPGFLAIEIDIDQPGTYTPSLEWVAMDTSPYVDLYLVKAPSDETDVAFWEKVKVLTIWKDTAVVTRAGCYKILTGVDPIGTVKMQPTSDGGDESGIVAFSTVTITKNDTGSYYLMFVPNGASENVAAKLATSGTYCSMQPKSFSLTRVEEDTALTKAFTPDDTNDVEAAVYTNKVTALPYVDGAEVAQGVSATATQLADGTYQMSTSTTDNGNTFLYWVKGLDGGAKRVVSRAESFVYAPTGGVVNYLIAVYEKNGAKAPKAEFYNANGLLYETVEEASGTTPELPTMAGYGTANCWVAENGTTYAGNAPITVDETMMLIAEYDDPTADITVTTDENCKTDKTEYAYGDKVTCTLTGNGEGKFYAWTKDGEIVSTDPEKYEFSAWEDCTVNAVYKEDYVPITSVARKIIIDVFENNNVMAEFIGFDNAVEKGIYLDTTKITMTSQKSQFTVELGDATSAKGYAVVKNDDGTYTEYIDGSYEKE